MSGMYPNGGYRNKQASELSMPRQATPPIVTSNPASVSGNNATPRMSSVDLRDQVNVDIAQGRGSVATRKSVTLDLSRFNDKHGGSLTYGERDRMRGNAGPRGGQVRIDIDLKGSDYRVNGRGAVVRAAIKAARQLIRAGRRLPKNVWAELVGLIVDGILGQLDRQLWPQAEHGVDVYVPDGIGSATGGVWALNTDIASYNGGNTISYKTPEPVTGIRGTGGAPAEGELISGSFSALPSGSTSAINTWVANGKVPYYTNRNEIANEARPLVNESNTLNYIYRNVVVGRDGDPFNSQLIATLRIQRQTAATVTPWTRYRPLTASLLFPYGDKEGGNDDGRPVKVDERWRHVDQKFGMSPGLQRIAAAAFGLTEFGDLIDSFYDALPKNRQYGRSYFDKLKRIHRYWNEIDFGKALTNVVYNHYEDKLVGKVMGTAGKQLRKTDIGGTNYKYGVTSGGGSTIYTGDIAF